MFQPRHELPKRRSFEALRIVMMLAGLLCLPVVGLAQYDICGCEGHPDSLGAFNLDDPATWPPGTKQSTNRIDIPLPPDGVMVFDSFSTVASTSLNIHFVRNARNTPVRLLVAGNVTIQQAIWLDGDRGGDSGSLRAGQGGLGGPGGFRGGDGAYWDVNGTNTYRGAHGLGPGGGGDAQDGRFAGPVELRPLIGGSGGAGGNSTTTGNCPAGGGGGGGGAILIASNTRININGPIYALGGDSGFKPYYITCATDGYHGSGGAIRLVAPLVTGTGPLYARAHNNNAAGNGIIRIEAATDTYTGTTAPAAIRTAVMGPLVNPVASEIRIIAINDELVPETLTGPLGGIDFLVPSSGLNTFNVETLGVPAGTTLQLTIKNKAGRPDGGVAVINETGVINAANCDSEGRCDTLISVDLATGAYYVEAQATFQVP
jgi:hypothetical protein